MSKTDRLEEERQRELVALDLWRSAQLVDLGFTPEQAILLRLHDVDWHVAADLVEAGCDHALAVRILT